jgi:anti-sigma factor RsiW
MKPVTCEAGVRELMNYLEGTVPAPLRLEMEAHVAGCAFCRAFIASYRETPRILREATDRAPSPEQRRAIAGFLRSHGAGG